MKDILNQARSQQDTSAARDRNIGIITMYKNGFRIGQGEFRDAKDPENAKFVNALKNGDVPSELEAEVKKEWNGFQNVGIHLVDKSSEIYVPSSNNKPAFDFSKSKGHSMSSLTNSAPASSLGTTSFAKAKPVLFEAKMDQPITDIVITLHSRKRDNAKFNQSATVFDLFQHVMAVSKENKFELLAGFPPKPLNNPSATLKEAGLIAANIQQRLLK